MSLNTTVPYLLIGAGVGWLMGLSLTPVVASVLAAVLALATAAAAAAAGVKARDQDTVATRVEAWPIAFLLVGMAIAASAAISVREGELLVPTAFRSNGAISADAGASDERRQRGGLYGGPAPAACDRVRRAEGAALRTAFLTAPDTVFREIAVRVEDNASLEVFRDLLCRGA